MRPFNSLFNPTTTAAASDTASPAPAPEKPQAEPLLAGTLALMTQYSQGCCDMHSLLIARKIAGNLSALSAHPGASVAFQAMTANLRVLWLNVLDTPQRTDAPQAEPTPSEPVPSAATITWPPQPVNANALWHTTPETLQ